MASWFKFYYCPICGDLVLYKDIICPTCKNYITPCESIHDKSYYRQKSKELYGTEDKTLTVLREEEISKNPLYNPDTTEHNAAEEFERRMRDKKWEESMAKSMQKEKNVPKCPTCGSTNIRRIPGAKRAIHGAAFGIFSKTARSQFECLHCKYKW